MMYWKPVAWFVGGIVVLFALWGGYKLVISQHAVADAKLQMEYENQKDSTKAWRDLYAVTEKARKNLHDTLAILDNLRSQSSAEAQKWHDVATSAKSRLILIQRPAEGDSTNPRWMHRAIQLETTVAAQDKELALKDNQISFLDTKGKLLMSQMSKDSVALHSANGNIARLDKLVDEYKSKSECKVARVLPCLSRTQSFVLGGIGGIGGVVLINTTFKHRKGA